VGTRARGTFTIDRVSEEPFHERDGVRLIRSRLTKTFTGDIEGTSSTEVLIAYGHAEDSLVYLGFELIEGTLHGRHGSFILRHSAAGSGGVISGSASIVPDSGTGELHQLRGSAEVALGSTGEGKLLLLLDYELGPD
jgi:uncharacterized protein DUF3224